MVQKNKPFYKQQKRRQESAEQKPGLSYAVRQSSSLTKKLTIPIRLSDHINRSQSAKARGLLIKLV